MAFAGADGVAVNSISEDLAIDELSYSCAVISPHRIREASENQISFGSAFVEPSALGSHYGNIIVSTN
jgi:hypothetical protein